MAYTPLFTNRFQKDLKLATKRGKDTRKIKTIITQLIKEQSPARKHQDHPLTGNYSKHRECHIEPDWLLIYRIDHKTIIFERTGTHSDLF